MRHPCIFIAFLIINLSHGQVLKLKKYKTIINNKSFVSKIEKFDPHGNLVSSITYPEGNNKKEIYKENHIYNFQNQLVEDSFYTISKEGTRTLIRHSVYNYYTNGLQKSHIELENDLDGKADTTCGANFYSVYTRYYDINGKLNKFIVRSSCSDTNHFNELVYFDYDTIGRLISETHYHQDTTRIESKTISFYDFNGNRIKEEHYFTKGDSLELIMNFQFDYNSNGRVISYKHIRSKYIPNKHVTIQTIPHSINYFYNKNGLLIREEHFDHEKPIEIKEFYYKRGNLFKTNYFNFEPNTGKKSKKVERIYYEYQ